MIQCKFCGGKNESKYLLLACKHLSCLSCSFLRADFGKQQIQCCQKITKIDNIAMESIIISKRNTKIFGEIAGNSLSVKPQISQILTEKKQQFNISSGSKQNISPIKKEQFSQIKNTIKLNKTQQQQSQQQLKQVQLYNVLISQIQRIKKQFEAERRNLRQRQQAKIKELIFVYEQEVQKVQRPITHIKLQNLNNLLTEGISLHRLRNKCKQQIPIQNLIQTQSVRQSREKTDYIIKKLQLNQQKMNQRLQKHSDSLY